MDDSDSGTVATVGTGTYEGTSLGKLPQLRAELATINADLGSQERIKSQATSVRDTAKNAMDVELPKITSVHTGDLIDNPLYTAAQQQFASSSTSIGAALAQIEVLRGKQAEKLAEIQAEAQIVQQNIVSSQFAAGVYGQVGDMCDSPQQVTIPSSSAGYASADDLQNSYDAAVNQILGGTIRITAFETVHNAELGTAEQTSFFGTIQEHIDAGRLEPAAFLEEDLTYVMDEARRQSSVATDVHRVENFTSHMSPSDAAEFQALLSDLGASGDLGPVISGFMQGEVTNLVMEAIDACGGNANLETTNILRATEGQIVAWREVINGFLNMTPATTPNGIALSSNSNEGAIESNTIKFKDGRPGADSYAGMTFEVVKSILQIGFKNWKDGLHTTSAEEPTAPDYIKSRFKLHYGFIKYPLNVTPSQQSINFRNQSSGGYPRMAGEAGQKRYIGNGGAAHRTWNMGIRMKEIMITMREVFETDSGETNWDALLDTLAATSENYEVPG